MSKLIPGKLKPGDEVRVIAPSRSLGLLSAETKETANERFKELGLKLSFGKHVTEQDEFNSSPIQSRIEDLHEAFADSSIKAVITVIGGFNSNQLLDYIDWALIRNNPKILCGYSDITALNNAFYAKTGLVTYSGPHYSSFGQKKHFDYTLEYFKKCLMDEAPFEILPSRYWSDDAWYLDQEKRELIANPGFDIIHEGTAEGTIIGANLCTLNLLQGSRYMPDLTNSVLFIEDDYETVPHTFDRDLQSLIHQPGFAGVAALVIGRFQKASKMKRELLRKIIETKKELAGLPVIAGVEFGHSDPKSTFAVGGTVTVHAATEGARIEVTQH